MGRLRGAGLGDLVAKRRGQHPAQPRNVPDRQLEGPNAVVVMPHAEHDQVMLGMPADAQDDAPLVDEEIPAGRQPSHVPHHTSVDGCRTEGKTRRPSWSTATATWTSAWMWTTSDPRDLVWHKIQAIGGRLDLSY
jgi:hypothetical protein